MAVPDLVKMKSEEREQMPFFILVAAVMIFLFGLTIYTRADLRIRPASVVFSSAMVIHTVLHWFYRVFARVKNRVLIYFGIQTVLATFIVFYTGEPSLTFGLFLPLLGEEAGIFRTPRAVIISVLINSAMIAVSLYRKINGESFEPLVFAGIIPMVFFVIIYVGLYSRQNEAKLRAEGLLRDLEEANEKLATQNSRIEQLTKEQERQRIARELHDTLAQGLSGLILQLEAASAHLQDRRSDKAEEIIEKAMGKARETLAEARKVIDDLRKSGSPEANLISFIKEQQAVFSQKSGINLTVRIESKPEFDAVTEYHLMKIIAEALNNCALHSGAARAVLELCGQNGDVKLTVSDNGKGFDPDLVSEGHYGLIGIRERCGLLGASLSIESGGKGTSLTVIIPGGGGA